jgi:cytochrome b6-f complex iron-sulfur subunit
MAIYKVCTHLGCLYNWDDQEVRFKCPCHGSQFQPDGTYIQGPAPRSLDRFVIELVDPGTGQVISTTNEEGDPLPVPEGAQALIRVDTGVRIQGKPHA